MEIKIGNRFINKKDKNIVIVITKILPEAKFEIVLIKNKKDKTNSTIERSEIRENYAPLDDITTSEEWEMYYSWVEQIKKEMEEHQNTIKNLNKIFNS
jgi:GTP-binding protein EngB required for normal cell division